MTWKSVVLFVGAAILGSERVEEFLADRETAWQAAEPFNQWWSRHPELHRDRMVA